jgi:hypothetical protein
MGRFMSVVRKIADCAVLVTFDEISLHLSGTAVTFYPFNAIGGHYLVIQPGSRNPRVFEFDFFDFSTGST